MPNTLGHCVQSAYLLQKIELLPWTNSNYTSATHTLLDGASPIQPHGKYSKCGMVQGCLAFPCLGEAEGFHMATKHCAFLKSMMVLHMQS